MVQDTGSDNGKLTSHDLLFHAEDTTHMYRLYRSVIDTALTIHNGVQYGTHRDQG